MMLTNFLDNPDLHQDTPQSGPVSKFFKSTSSYYT